MRLNHTLNLLRSSQMALGGWLQLCSIPAARMLAAQGSLDWLMVDLEHTPLDRSTAWGMYTAIADVSQGRCTPIARLAGGSMEEIKQALDGGAQGILVPLVNTPEQAASVVRWGRYPPLGERGAGGLDPHLGFGASRADYLAQANEQIMIAVQIETSQAVENFAAIAAIPGLDMAFIGPFDLHISLGLPGAFWSEHPAFLSAVERVLAACREHRLPAGILCADASGALARREQGFTFIGLATDAIYLLNAYGEQVSQARSLPEPQGGWSNCVRLD